MTILRVLAVGPLATLQDLGRPGHASIGVTTSGAADRDALRLANRLLGNHEDATCIEVLLGGLTIEVAASVTVAVTGAPTPLWRNDTPVPSYVPLLLAPGDRLRMGPPVTGLRTYLAVGGGIVAEQLFGSASTDRTAALGPPVLAAGSQLAIGSPRPRTPGADTATAAALAPSAGGLVLRAVLGPRSDWFTDVAVRTLVGSAWTVTSESDRVGVRLLGPTLQRSRDDELPSEGVVRGAVQVPASGQPLVFGADHPTTGGYPVIAVVLDQDVDLLAQARPGAVVRFAVRPPAW